MVEDLQSYVATVVLRQVGVPEGTVTELAHDDRLAQSVPFAQLLRGIESTLMDRAEFRPDFRPPCNDGIGERFECVAFDAVVNQRPHERCLGRAATHLSGRHTE